ncbi:MAG TPA: PilT/PilU family type 4a pilus ATPase [Acidothermaceae bacterium]
MDSYGFFPDPEGPPAGNSGSHASGPLDGDAFGSMTDDADPFAGYPAPAAEYAQPPSAYPAAAQFTETAPTAPAGALPPLAPPSYPDPGLAAALGVDSFAPVAPVTSAPPAALESGLPHAQQSPIPSAMPVSDGESGPHGRLAMEKTDQLGSVALTDMLVAVLERGGSDLHITAGARPTLRVNGSLVPLDEGPEMTPPVIQQMMYQILTQRQRERFEEELELDFAYALPGRARFRVNLYRQREALGAAFRLIPYEIKSLESLGIPPAVANFAMMPRGFVLVTGPTGSGKSTTLAALVDLANRNRHDHIITVEDPIEFLHRHKSCLVNQREVGDDTHSFSNALKHVLRQDPDIILVGEMRDLETISVALTAAETGHLVFATLHTQDAAQTIDRVIDVFPPHQQQQVRVQLAGSLQGIVAQTLCKTSDGRGRVAATEVLVATPAIRNLIREGKTHQIYSALQSGARHGMHTMDQHLVELIHAGRITYEVGLEKCHHIEDFNRLAGRG